MAKTIKDPITNEEELAFEMIELSCSELDTLTRAFEVIDEVCRELQSDVSNVDFATPPRQQLH